MVGARPTLSRYVLIAAPHTSNWDFVMMLLYGMAYNIRPQWIGKHTLFRPPFGALARALGGIPVRRDTSNNLVEQLVAQFAARDALVLVMPPEGSRARTPFWKSGFYHVARGARVPIVASVLDYARKEGGFGPTLLPGADLSADMDLLRAFYADKCGLHPALQGPVRLRQESDGHADEG